MMLLTCCMVLVAQRSLIHITTLMVCYSINPTWCWRSITSMEGVEQIQRVGNLGHWVRGWGWCSTVVPLGGGGLMILIILARRHHLVLMWFCYT